MLGEEKFESIYVIRVNNSKENIVGICVCSYE